MLPLFAYGTLRDAEYQRELFGRTFPTASAVVRGFRVTVGGGGYLAAVPQPDGVVRGSIVELDAAAYAIADAWEDLAVYQRIDVVATTDAGADRRAFIYVRFDAHGPPVTHCRNADLPRETVLADIRRFRSET